MTTVMAVINRPRSTAADGSKESREKSSEPHWENKAFGRGAKTNNRAGSDRQHQSKGRYVVANQRGEVTNSTTGRTRV